MLFDISVCSRHADRAGHRYGPTEPDVKYELHGPLHETGCPLAEDGQPKGEVTNNLPPLLLLLLLDVCKPSELPLIPELPLRLVTVVFIFTSCER